MFRSWLPALGLVCGCGRFGFSDRHADRDATGAGPDARDAPSADASVCHTGAFGPPQLIGSLATGSEEAGPSISADELTLFFSSNRVPSQARAIWTTTRSSRAAPFDVPTLVSELDSVADDKTPAIAADGLTLYFDSKVSGSDQLYYATRPDLLSPFTNQGPLVVTGSPGTMNVSPSVTPDELMLLYSSDGLDVAIAKRPDRGSTFTFQRLLSEVNAAPSDGDPSLSADGLELFFDSYRTGPNAIFTSQRATTGDAFAAPTQLSALDPGGFGAGSPELSADGRTLYFYIDNGSQLDLYTATRDCP